MWRPGWLRSGLIVLAVVALIVVGAAAVWLRFILHPPRPENPRDPGAFLLSYEEVSFLSADGLRLAGWFLTGRRGSPALVIAHDHGEDRSQLLNTAIPLQKAGYNVFLLDFRGHGRSQGTTSLGIQEMRDVLGAVDYLVTRDDVDPTRVGLLGIRMGAHAGVLAAQERRELRALALDTPYPDVRTCLAGRISDSDWVQRLLTPLPALLYDLQFRTSSRKTTAARALPGLSDRNLLFVVAGDDPLAGQVRTLYESVRETKGAEKNLLVLEGTRPMGLYAGEKRTYDEALRTFFGYALPLAAPDKRRPS